MLPYFSRQACTICASQLLQPQKARELTPSVAGRDVKASDQICRQQTLCELGPWGPLGYAQVCQEYGTTHAMHILCHQLHSCQSGLVSQHSLVDNSAELAVGSGLTAGGDHVLLWGLHQEVCLDFVALLLLSRPLALVHAQERLPSDPEHMTQNEWPVQLLTLLAEHSRPNSIV